MSRGRIEAGQQTKDWKESWSLDDESFTEHLFICPGDSAKFSSGADSVKVRLGTTNLSVLWVNNILLCTPSTHPIFLRTIVPKTHDYDPVGYVSSTTRFELSAQEKVVATDFLLFDFEQISEVTTAPPSVPRHSRHPRC